jgi:gas vesicle protein
MTTVKQPEKQLTKMTQHSPTLGLGIFGAIAGAAIGSVAAIYLSDQKNREQLQKQISLFRDRAIKVMDTFTEQEKKTEQIKQKLDDIEENVHTIQR